MVINALLVINNLGMDTHKPTHIIDLQTKQYFQKPNCVVASNRHMHMSDLKLYRVEWIAVVNKYLLCLDLY